MASEQKAKKGFKFNFKTMLILFALVPLIPSVVVISLVLATNSRSLIKDTIHNYMYEVAVISGQELDNEIAAEGLDKALSADELSTLFSETKIKGLDSSYVYVVSKDGTMLYHPTAEKIGSSVENEVVKGVVADIAAGKTIEPAVVEYLYKGAMKYAAYYVDANSDYILVVSADETDAMAGVNKITRIAVIIAIAFIVFFLVGVLLMQKKVVAPLKAVTESTEKLSEGNLASSQDMTSALDETKQLINAYNTLQQELREVITKAQSVSSELTEKSENILNLATNAEEGTNQISDAMEDLAQGATSLAENTQTISEQVSEISDIINEISDNVKALGISSENIQKANDNAAECMSKVSVSSGKSVDSVTRIVKQINEQNESIEAIGRAVDSIQSIAGQTNLLALNASIEAARAGEAGRGFAVVATEIGSLSEQSNAAAVEINQIVTEIINQSSVSAKLAKEVGDVISEEQGFISDASDGFEALRAEIDTSLAAITTISGRMVKLDSIRNVIATNVSDLGAVSEENAASNQEVSASLSGIATSVQSVTSVAQEINTLSTELNDTIDYFK